MLESILGCKWSLQILSSVRGGLTRPSEFLRAIPGLTPKVMNERLRKLVEFGILEREVVGDKPPIEVHYKLTPFGKKFSRLLDEISRLQEELDFSA